MKRILITGASRGIGYELCKQLLSQNIEVIATYRSENKTKLLSDLKENSENLHLFKMDVNSDESVQNAINLISVKFDYIDTIFNNEYWTGVL